MLFASVLLAAPGMMAAQIYFYGVGDLPGGAFRSEIRDAVLTPGGIIAVGTASRFSVGSDTPIKWTPTGGLTLLANDFPTNTTSTFVAARVIALNGAVIGGSTWNAAFGPNRGPAIWTGGGSTVTRLGFLGGAPTFFPNVGVNALSADGSVAYGFTRSVNNSIAAYRYTIAGGMVDIGYLHPTDNSNFTTAHSASADGSVVVGNSSLNFVGPGPEGGLQAYRYTHTGTGPTGGVMIGLPALPGDAWTFALAMTPDGSKTIGISGPAASTAGQVVSWDAAGNVTLIGAPPGATSFVNFGGVTADGATLVVATQDGTFLHNPSGWFHLQDLLTAAGIDLTGWAIDTVFGISADGRLVYGLGTHNGNPEGYIVQLPPDFMKELGDTTPPVLTLPADITVEAAGPAGSVVNFAASAEDAVDGTLPVTYSHAPGSLFPLGTTEVTVSATDDSGNTATGSFTVTVGDTTPPAITSLVTNAPSLWPPNHKMVPVIVTAVTSDLVGPVAVQIVSVTSNEPDNGQGDGDTPNDIVITGAMSVNLRAERGGGGNGRIYTITVEARDAAGNVVTGTVTVSVPKNKGGN